MVFCSVALGFVLKCMIAVVCWERGEIRVVCSVTRDMVTQRAEHATQEAKKRVVIQYQRLTDDFQKL